MRTGMLLCSVAAAVCFAAQLVAPSPDSVGVVAGAAIDALSSEPLHDGIVTVDDTIRGSYIDSAGHFSVPLVPGKHRLVADGMDYARAGKYADVLAGCTTEICFYLLPQRHVNDSILGSFAEIRIRELSGYANRYRTPEQIAINNAIRVGAWRTYLEGKGTYGIKKTLESALWEPSYDYLLIESGRCRTVEDARWYSLGPRIVSEHHVTKLILTNGKRLAPDSTHYVGVPFDGSVPKDRELRFQFLDDAGYIIGSAY
jgi:hypothetical protein